MVNESSYLIHHGIKGQKWGIRRYQNPDGTLTQRGQKRMQSRNAEIKSYQGSIDYDKKVRERGILEEAKIRKKVLNNDEKEINKQYEKAYGYDDPKSLGYKSKKEAVLDSLDNWKTELKYTHDMEKYYQRKIDAISKTPINKLTRSEMTKVSKGVNKTALALNTIGSVALSVALKKYTNISTGDAIKVGMLADLFTTGFVSANSYWIAQTVSDKREKKYGV